MMSRHFALSSELSGKFFSINQFKAPDLSKNGIKKHFEVSLITKFVTNLTGRGIIITRQSKFIMTD